MVKNIKKELRRFRDVSPRSEWKAQNRDFLMSQISKDAIKEKEEVSSFGFFASLNFMFSNSYRDSRMGRPILALFLVAALLLGGGDVTVDAAKESVPGDKLYFVKRSLEKTQLQFASEKDRVRLEVSFVEERVNELKKIASDEKKSEKVIPVLEEISQGFYSAKSKLGKIKEEADDSKGVVEIAKLVDEKSDEVASSLENVEFEDDFVVEATISSVKSVGLDALKVIAQEVEAGTLETEEEKGEVADRIIKKIESLNEEAKSLKENDESLEEGDSPLDEPLEEISVETEKGIESNDKIVEDVSVETTEEEFSVEGTLDVLVDVEESQKLLDQDEFISAVDKLEKTQEALKTLKESIEVEEFNEEDSDLSKALEKEEISSDEEFSEESFEVSTGVIQE